MLSAAPPEPASGRAAGFSLRRPSAAFVAAGIVTLGVFFSALNADLPIVRNALLYAQIAEDLWSHGMRLWTVCSDPAIVFNKPCGLGAVAAPLVHFMGINAGLIWATVAGGVLLVAATWAFLRHFNPRFGLGSEALPLELALCFFNPLLIYQFWSAYSDVFFTAGFLYGFVIFDRLLHERAGAKLALAYFGLFVFSSLMKHGTVVLLPLDVAYLLWHKRELRLLWRERRTQVYALVAALIACALFLLLGRLGHNPLLNLVANKSQLEGELNYPMNVKQVVFFLLIALGSWVILLPLIEIRLANAALFTVMLLNIHLLTIYRGSSFNMRYYMATLPILAPYLVVAFRKLRSVSLRTALVGSFLVLNGLGIVVFNTRTLYRGLTAALPNLYMGATSYFDNLRMGDHLESADLIAAVNHLPPHAKLFHVSSYYGEGGFGVLEQAGFFRPDISISYRNDLTPAAIEELHAAGAYAMYPPPFAPEPLPTMEAITPRLFRIP